MQFLSVDIKTRLQVEFGNCTSFHISAAMQFSVPPNPVPLQINVLCAHAVCLWVPLVTSSPAQARGKKSRSAFCFYSIFFAPSFQMQLQFHQTVISSVTEEIDLTGRAGYRQGNKYFNERSRSASPLDYQPNTPSSRCGPDEETQENHFTLAT